tara:strand:+ start:18098 stop:19156 length:1059 start_codon:yes stop_codon:yes gene_type:complete
MMENSSNIPEHQLKSILEELGYKLTDRGQYWHSHAAFRQGDNQTAIQIWKNSGVWRDFVENTPPLPFFKLLELHFGKDKASIEKYLQHGYTSSRPPSTQADRITMEKIYDESILDELLPHYQFYNDKGIDTDVLKVLKGGYATKGKMLRRFVFPIYNESFQIQGFSGRDMSDNSSAPKWKHIGRKSKWIYPYYTNPFCADAIKEQKSVVLVESIGDLLNLNQNNYYNVLVSFGLDISPKLLCHLIGLDVDKIIISFNNDEGKVSNRGARAAVKNYLKLLTHFDPSSLSICLPVKNDFGDMEPSDFSLWSEKCNEDQDKRRKDIFTFAEKLASANELPSAYLKNLKILRSYVE